MIEIGHKQDCCGCTACASICPQHCISMREDNEGFKYPITDTDLCVNCQACNKVCPIINKKEARTPLRCYAAKNKDKEVLLESSSGGVFSVLAEYVLSKGGVVFGARWEGNSVIHDYVECTAPPETLNLQGLLTPYRGSKYVQSDLKNTFEECRTFLKQGRYVLFSGTPCEIGGLTSFLKKDYDNLLTVDVACHGAPSPKVLKLYMEYLRKQYGEDVKLDFRSKSDGWQNYKVTAYSGEKHFFYEGQKENIFMKGFLRELYSRPSCHECAFKEFRSQSDITLADFWGINEVLPSIDSYHGISLLCANTEKARYVVTCLKNKCQLLDTNISDALKYNCALMYSEDAHPERSYFFKLLNKMEFSALSNQCLTLRPITKLKLTAKSYLQKLGL